MKTFQTNLPVSNLQKKTRAKLNKNILINGKQKKKEYPTFDEVAEWWNKNKKYL